MWPYAKLNSGVGGGGGGGTTLPLQNGCLTKQSLVWPHSQHNRCPKRAHNRRCKMVFQVVSGRILNETVTIVAPAASHVATVTI